MVFLYVAYYDAEAIKWYKEDQFQTNFKHTEEIKEYISGWAEDTSVFVG